jgi:hypothetical protein
MQRWSWERYKEEWEKFYEKPMEFESLEAELQYKSGYERATVDLVEVFLMWNEAKSEKSSISEYWSGTLQAVINEINRRCDLEEDRDDAEISSCLNTIEHQLKWANTDEDRLAYFGRDKPEGFDTIPIACKVYIISMCEYWSRVLNKKTPQWILDNDCFIPKDHQDYIEYMLGHEGESIPEFEKRGYYYPVLLDVV